MQPFEITGGAVPEPSLERPVLVTRAPRRTDLDAIVRIDRQWAGANRREFLLERLEKSLRPGAINLSRVVERDGKVLGFVFGEVTRGEFGHVGPIAWIDTIGVDRDAARAGVGSALLAEFMSHAQAAGSERVRTLLEPDDDVLTEFLEDRGFRLAPVVVVERALGPDL